MVLDFILIGGGLLISRYSGLTRRRISRSAVSHREGSEAVSEEDSDSSERAVSRVGEYMRWSAAASGRTIGARAAVDRGAGGRQSRGTARS
ncbi:unnamed protein product [Arctia plantaginis]|uniref:Uncharacterized protein n=1 Tax=Arctia plantaginis TaxID=874455 RepID=A0A8S0ZKC8_ARCPL|nr:unnamed protein product [Arctia plantaginis]